MSAKTMGQVWDLDIPHNQLIVLLAMTDHADHSGGNMFPSMGLIAHKTGYSERQVKRIVKELVRVGLLVLEKIGNGTVNTYRADFSNAKKKEAYTRDKMSPLNESTSDKVMSPQVGHPDVTTTHDIQMSPEPSLKPSVNHNANDQKVITMPQAVMEKNTTNGRTPNMAYEVGLAVANLFGIQELKSKRDKSFYIGIGKVLVEAGINVEGVPHYKAWVEKLSKNQGGWEVTPNSLTAKSRPSLYVAKRDAHKANESQQETKPQSSVEAAEAHILNILRGA